MSLTKKHKLSRRLWWYAFRFVGKMRLPGLGAFLFSKALNQNVKRHKGKNIIRLLALNKESFSEDILTAFGSDDRFEICSVDVVQNKAFKAMSWAFLTGAIGDNNYVSNKEEIIKRKKEYRSFLEKFWLKLKSYIKIDAVLTANFSYYAERELSAALQNLGTPFVVLHKENLKTPGLIDFYHDLYKNRRGPFLGRKILVYNEIEKMLQIEAGVITPDRVFITGMPRLDKIHKWRKETSKRTLSLPKSKKQVLFFSFGLHTGLPILPRKAGSGIPRAYEKIDPKTNSLNWGNLVRESHIAIIQLAMKNPEIKVFIKAKGRTMETSALFETLGESSSIPSNVEIVVGGDPFDLITQSNVICGFITTALLEAIAAGKPVVMPWFAEALDKKMQPYIVDLQDAIEYAHSPEDLINRLSFYALNPKPPTINLTKEAIQMLDKWVGNSDGLAGIRVREALLNEIFLAK